MLHPSYTKPLQCSAERPKCSRCLDRKSLCEYEDTQKQTAHQKYKDLRKQQDTYEELLNQLVNLPENESLGVLRQIRAGNHAGLLPFQSPRSQHDCDNTETNVREVHNNVLKRKNEHVDQRPCNTTELYGLLQHTSEDGAEELLDRMRQGMSPEDVPVFTGQLLSRRSPSSNQTNRSIMPPTDTSIEFDLVSLHPNAYPSLVPLDIASLNLGLLEISPLRSFRPSRRDFTSNVGKVPHFTSPSSPSGYIDARLGSIQMRRWSNVAISDDLAARVLNAHLVNDSPWLAYFNIDLFLDDFVNGRNRFCSPLLVSSLFAWACVSFLSHRPHFCASITYNLPVISNCMSTLNPPHFP